MAMTTWWLYVTTVFLIAATPGPNMLHVMVQSIRQGTRRVPASMAGLMTVNLMYLTASAAGLGTLLKASPVLFELLRYAGVAYLVWLGIKAWRAPVSTGEANAAVETPRSLRSLYLSGFATGLSNPKLIVFAAALLPQFLDTGRPFLPQLAVLILSFMAIELFWFTMYAAGGRSLSRWLASAPRQKLFNRVTGTLFIGFGAALLGSRV